MVRRARVQKHAIRQQVFQRLNTQQEDTRRRKSGIIRRRLTRLAAFRHAKTVCCYVSLPYEVDTRRLITQMLVMGKRVVVPKVARKRLILSEVQDPARDLAPGRFGVWEPIPQAVRPVSVEELDLVVVPGVAFDRDGHRLGHGFGYFDRFLARVPDVPTVGLCFDFQLFDRLPRHPHDRAVQTVLSA